MEKGISRRVLLGGLGAILAQPGLAKAPMRSPVPLRRPADFTARSTPSLQALIATAGLGGKFGCVVADARSGRVLEALNPLLQMPPASVSKAVTAAYALDMLGPDHVFTTRLVATGPVEAGRIQGDLVLVGGAWRTLAKAEMARVDYPLHVLMGYEIAPEEAVFQSTRSPVAAPAGAVVEFDAN